MDEFFVEVVSHETGEVVQRMGPMTASKAELVERGLDRKLNHERFFTRVVRGGDQRTPGQS